MTTQTQNPPAKKYRYFTAIRKDKLRGIHPIQNLTLAGIAVHARTATYDFEAQEASYHPGQVQSLTEAQAKAALEAAKKFRVQWTLVVEDGAPANAPGRWRSEVVDPSSKIYEGVDRTIDPETGRVLKEEVELAPYVLIQRHHDDDEIPPLPPGTASQAEEVKNAEGIEREEEEANPRENAETKREQRDKKKGGAAPTA